MIVRPVKVRGGDVLLVPGDIHFKHHDPVALDLMITVAAANRVNTVTLVGDTFESAGISRHTSLRRRASLTRDTVAREAEAAAPYLSQLQECVRYFRGAGRGSGLHVLTGNHEFWWNELQEEYPGLTDTPWFELYGDLFNNWHVHAEYTALRFGSLLVCHGHRLRGSLSSSTAATVLRNYPGQNTLYGHTHRVDAAVTPSYKYGRPVDHGAWSVGHMRAIRGEMIDPFLGPHAERHKQGFALVFFYDVDGALRFKTELVTVDRTEDGRPYCIAGGTLYEGSGGDHD